MSYCSPHQAHRAIAVCTLFMAIARTSGAQAALHTDTLILDLRTVQRLALTQNPSLLAVAQDVAIARGERRQARTYPLNPELGLVAPGLSQSAASLYEVSLTQEIEWAGQRGIRASAADFGVTRATAGARDAARRTAGAASIAFYRTAAAQARMRLAVQAMALGDRLISAVRIQLREGEISALEGNLAEMESGRSRARALTARRELAAAELELKELTGLPPEQPVRVDPDSTPAPRIASLPTDSLIRQALSRRPDVTEAAAAIQQADRLIALARREATPNLRVGVVAERDEPGAAQRLGLALGVGLPLLNRNRGLVERRRAESLQLALQARALELAVRTDVANAARAFETAAAEAAVYETLVLEPARRNAELLDSAYRAGKFPLSTLLLLRNQLVEAEQEYWEAWFALREAAVRLDMATATIPLDSFSPASPPRRNTP